MLPSVVFGTPGYVRQYLDARCRLNGLTLCGNQFPKEFSVTCWTYAFSTT